MKATGIVGRIDDLGRISIPKELRKVYGINEGDPMEIYTDEDAIILKKYQPRIPQCCICGDTEPPLLHIEGVYVCRNCGTEVIDKFMEG